MLAELLVVSLYVILTWVSWKRDKSNPKMWWEILFKIFLPIIVSVGWLCLSFVGLAVDAWILLMVLAGLVLFGVFHYSEFVLMDSYTNSGNKLILMNFFRHETIYNELNVYFDDSYRILDIGKTIRNNIKGVSEEERAEYEKLIATLEDYELNVLFVALNDFIPTNDNEDFDFIRFLQIYYVNYSNKKQKQDEKSIAKIDEFIKLAKQQYKEIAKKDNLPQEDQAVLFQKIEELKRDLAISSVPRLNKVLNLNCVRLEDELVEGRAFATILGIEGQRDEDLLKNMYKLRDSLENLKLLPQSYLIDVYEDEISVLKNNIFDLRHVVARLKDDREVLNSQLDEIYRSLGR